MISSTDVSRRPIFIGIGLIAFVVIAYQVVLTRIFSAMLFYHFAFVGISLVMLGLTAGAQQVYLKPVRFAVSRLPAEWTKAAVLFSVTMVATLIAFLYAPLIAPGLLPLFMCLFAVPFMYGGICITLILSKVEGPVGRLYAADLLGASLGCLGIVAALFVLDPISAVFGLASLTAGAGWLMARGASTPVKTARFFCLFWLVIFVGHAAFASQGLPHVRVIWAKGKQLETALFERWNTFSLVRVEGPPVTQPFGWGFGAEHHETGPDQLGLNIDAQAGTVITKFNGDLAPLSYLGDDVINAGYQLEPIGSAAIIGVGGGRDILSALSFHVQHITGIELNPSIFEALTERFGDFSGHLDRRADVRLVNAEARSWLNQSGSSFDLIQISLIDTWATTAAGGLSLSENKLYTTDAWGDFLDHLNKGGLLTISRWFDPIKHRGEFYRLIATATATLKARGISDDQLSHHLLVLGVDGHKDMFAVGIVTLILSASPLTQAEVDAASRLAALHHFHVMMAPGTVYDDLSAKLIGAPQPPSFFAHLPLDLSPPSDDRPFFFHMLRFRDVLGIGRQATDDTDISGNNNLAVKSVAALLFITLILTLYFIFVPLSDTWKSIEDKGGIVPFLFYFSGIGLGFMLIEISQMQRLMIFLGHPVYGLTVVLFTLLLFGGVGSWTFNAWLGRSWFRAWMPPVLLVIVLASTGLLLPHATSLFRVYSTFARVSVSILLLAPAGFAMGMMFPLGMTMTVRYRPLQSWFWAINGATSVLGSVLGVVISMEYGISAAFFTGVGCYGVCLFLIGFLGWARRLHDLRTL